MSSRRLPMAGERSAPGEPLQGRRRPSGTVVSLVDCTGGLAAVELAVAMVTAGLRSPLIVESSRGGDPVTDRTAFPERSAPARLVEAGASDVVWVGTEPSALEDALAARADGLRITIGVEVPTRWDPWLLLLVTRGRPLTGWTPEARSLREHADVRLVDPRPAYARGLAELLADATG